MAELWLVCEGEPGSVDVALLQRVFADVLAAEIVVEPACGSSPGAVATFLETRRGGRAAFVHDRDYFSRAEAEASFADGTRRFLWRRHSIENYLLPPPIILRAFQNLRERFEHQRAGQVPAWFAALPAYPDGIAEALRDCARRRAAEEACRLANHRLWAGLPPTVGHVQQRNPTLPGDADPGHWREALCREAERVCQAAARMAECDHFRHEAVIGLFDLTYAELTAEAYLLGLDFLLDFHGRDLLRAFHQWLASRKVPLSFKKLCEELIPAAVSQYGEDRGIYGSDDFRDLANGVRELAGLAELP